MAGLVNGKLASPPSTPNCVSSQAPEDDAQHHIAPIHFEGDVEGAKQRLLAAIATMPRTTVVTDSGTYLHVTFRTAILRFVDDVEFLFTPEQGVIHVRSASRLGYSDAGLNRKRVEEIREAFAAQ